MITAEDIKRLEAESDVSSDRLMDTAGKKVVEVLKEKQEIAGKRVLVACYHGNNGGDGFVIANELSNDCEVDVLFLGDEEKMSESSRKYFTKVDDNPLIQFVSLETFGEYDIIVDAILGVGLRGNVKPEVGNAIQLINDSDAFVISVDVPSGLHPDTGEVAEKAVNADVIVTFHDMKKGLENFSDKVVVVDIGLGS